MYKRATPQQARILRIVEGSVKNAYDHHPDKIGEYNPRFARSIAKRAAGTLTAQWPEVLTATTMPSDWRAKQVPFSQPQKSQLSATSKRGASDRLRRRSPLKLLWGKISGQMKSIKNSGNVERFEAMRDVLRMIAKMEEKYDQDSD